MTFWGGFEIKLPYMFFDDQPPRGVIYGKKVLQLGNQCF